MDKNNKNTKPLELKVKILGKKNKNKTKQESFLWVNSMKTFLKLYHPISRWNHVKTKQRWRWKYNWCIQYGLSHCGAIYSTHYWIWNSDFTSITKNFQKFFEIHRLTASFSKKSRQRTLEKIY